MKRKSSEKSSLVRVIYDMEKEKIRASQQIEAFRNYYSWMGEYSLPVVMAKKWAALLNAPILDLDQMMDLAREASPYKNNFGMLYFGLSNHMELILHQCLEEYLSKR
jgi:hypothetical protein